VKDDGEIARMLRAAAIADGALARCCPCCPRRPSASSPRPSWPSPSIRPCAAAAPTAWPSRRSWPRARTRQAAPRARRAGHPRRRRRGDRLRGHVRGVPLGHDPHLLRGWPAPGRARPHLRGRPRQPGGGRRRRHARRRAKDVDDVCRKVISDAGWADRFEHGTVTAWASTSRGPDGQRTGHCYPRPGVVVTVEPGVYIPGIGGVRIEDTLVVTEDGSRALTNFHKDVAA